MHSHLKEVVMLKLFMSAIMSFLLIVFCAFAANAKVWEEVEPGLEMASFSLQQNSNVRIAVLRFNADHFIFKLFTVSENSSNPQTLMQWAKEHNLVAAINASMYLPDGKTSTGYMRSGKHVNNNHIAKGFGAFFLSDPKDKSLTPVRLVDRATQDWEELLKQYDVVVQNYRLIDSTRQVLWSPKKGREHSIAAIAQDGDGNILFLHCRQPIMAHTFASALLDIPLDVRTVMYVEGGAQAGMVLRSNDEETVWGGRHPSDFFIGSVSVALPNIIGVQRKPSGVND